MSKFRLRVERAIEMGLLDEAVSDMLHQANESGDDRMRDELLLHRSELRDIERSARLGTAVPESIEQRSRRLRLALIQDLSILSHNEDRSTASKPLVEAITEPPSPHKMATPTGQKRTKVFVSYSHRDLKWMEELRLTLRPYVRDQDFEVWDDSQIQKGSKWRDSIGDALAAAKVAVLLVTRYFFASDFIATEELPKLLEAAEREGVTILWIAVSASPYKRSRIEVYQCVNDPSRPLDSLNLAERNKAYVQIADTISKILWH